MKQTFDSNFPKSSSNTTTILNQDKRKVVSNLESMLKVEIDKREQAQRQLMDYRRRSLLMQTQFKRLLEKYDNHIAVINGHDSYGQQIWNKLVNQIERFNSDSQRMLEKRCGQIQSMMSRRINEILQKTQNQIKKNKKLSQEQYSSIKQEIKQALKIAKQIQTQNQIIKRQNKDLIFKVNLLKEQKSLLISQLNQKKSKLKSLMINIYEQENGSILSSPNTSRVKSKQNSTYQYSPIPKFICEPSFRDAKSTLQNPQFSKRTSVSKQKDRKQIILKTDNHFKLCLDRQRRKNVQLKSIVARLHQKIKQSNSLLEMSIHERPAISKQQSIKFYESLFQNLKYKLYVPGSKQYQLSFNTVQLSKLLEE